MSQAKESLHSLDLAEGSRLYFLGIAGTGMASSAGLAKAMGFEVAGSDENLYPPTSKILEESAISTFVPYNPENIRKWKPQGVVVGNVIGAQHPEMETIKAMGIPYTSFPHFLGEHILKKKTSVVVIGTHGKTTTTTLSAYLLKQKNEDPGWLIGGLPKNIASYHLGKEIFVIEGDEYDTAFFDKKSKFLHYYPKWALWPSLEWDHVDIFPTFSSMEDSFHAFLDLLPPERLVANIDDPRIKNVCEKRGILKKISSVSGYGHSSQTLVKVVSVLPQSVTLETTCWGRITLPTGNSFSGSHNASNLACVLGWLGQLPSPPSLEELILWLENFQGVRRRLELIGYGDQQKTLPIYEDFAHHPTAISFVLDTLKNRHPGRKIWSIFEPRSASSRRRVFLEAFAKAFDLAHGVCLGPCKQDPRIPPEQKMDTKELAEKINSFGKSPQKSFAFADWDAMLKFLSQEMRPGDVCVCFSSGDLGRIQHRLFGLLP